MIAVPCPLCGSTRAIDLFQAREFVLNRISYIFTGCQDCNHLFVNPAPDEAELESYYTEVVPRLRALYPPAADASTEAQADAPSELEKVDLLSSSGLLDQPGAVLDIGFGNGGFMLSMARQGWRCVGVEFTDKVDLSFDPAGRFEILFGLDSLREMKSGLFDLITLWHVLEHLRNPVEVLGLARRLLKPEGTLVVAVPNVSGLSFRIFRRHWFALSPPWHLQQFKPRSLGLAFYEAGLTVEEIRAFGEHPMRLCWTDSLTGMIEAIPSAWYESPLRMALRILRRGVAVAMPLLLRIEQGVGLPGAIVAMGKKNKLVELTGI